MGKKKVCRTCKLFTTEDICPLCKKSSFATTFQGRIHFLDTKKSRIAHEMDVTMDGEYAIKVR
ncbi:DNA-directed RNA polymerase subunit E'' [Candidatus Woesearchaeota archaeon]|nr:DNA-directed RNA polymerase subunit E'' [Candidatus Woesearchaeota archaeon]